MSQDNQNRDRQSNKEGQRQDWQNDGRTTREGRGTGSSDSQQNQDGGGRQDQSQDSEDTDEMDEDREDDDRTDGGPDRRNNIS